MTTNVTTTCNWVYRRFFLSDIYSAPRLFCFNTSDGFSFGQINVQNDELLCETFDTNNVGFQINHLCWLSNTIYRPSRKQIKIGLTTLSTSQRNQESSLIYQNNNTDVVSNLTLLDETLRLKPSSIDYNEYFDQISVSHLNGTVKIYHASQFNLSYQCTFPNHGVLHQLKWNPTELNLLLLAHQHQLNIFDFEHKTIGLTLNYDGKEHLADCAWKTNNIIIGRHRQQILIWDKRASREPIRNDTLDPLGQLEKLKCSLASPNHLISVYDARLAKIKIYDIRCLTMRHVESFDKDSSSFLDYYWTTDKMAIVVATHQGLLHWIDVNMPTHSKTMNNK